MTARETTRRLALGTLLALATGVSVGDDVVSAPDLRRGSRMITVALPDGLGPTTIHVPRTPASGVALLLHDRDLQPMTAVMDALAASTLLVPIDVARLAGAGPPAACDRIVERLALAVRRAERDAGLTTYQPPVVVGTGQAAAFVRALVEASDASVFPAGVGTPTVATPDSPTPCTGSPSPDAASRWISATTSDLPDAVTAALARDVPPMTTGHVPLDRWLAHFRLPLSAAWAAAPRAVVILMSDARGLRAPDEHLAAGLAARGIPVLTVDALHYFWQRRSPRDVAFELKRLVGALASLEVPILVGGTGFGAETMAVAARFVDDAPLSGLVLMNPGPSAFFEVEPPLPALVPLLRADWSTAEAVADLAVPTLCVSSGLERARLLCSRLSRTPRVTPATLEGDDTGRLVAIIARFADRLRPRIGPGDVDQPGQPRKPSR